MPQTLLGLVSFFAILAVCAATTFVGGRRERIAALSVALAMFASVMVQQTSTRWDPVWPLAAIDVLLLAVLGAIAWRPRRGWPLWAVGLQATMVAIDGLRAAEIGMSAYTYLAAVNVATYGLAATVGYAGWLAWRRRQAL